MILSKRIGDAIIIEGKSKIRIIGIKGNKVRLEVETEEGILIHQDKENE